MIDLSSAGELIERRRSQRHIAVRIAIRGQIIKGTRGDDRRHEGILARVGLNSEKMILLGKSRHPAHERLIGLNHDVSDMGADARQRGGRTTEHQAPFKKLEAALLPSHRGGTRSLLGELAPDR
jgi:hypothetical protein